MDAAKLHKNNKMPGELVLQNGRQAGARRPLGVPTTFVGRGPGCDVRLNVDGVDALHCLLVVGPDGVRLRDLDSAKGTQVNGAGADNVLLQHGDVLQIGPFQFRVELPTPVATDADAPEEEVRDSLRIQAAAVAAQQIALEEEEARLEQRRSDLQQQEEQLAAHLAEKQRQIHLWSEYTKAERETLRREKLDHEKRMDRLEQELLQAKEVVNKDHHKLTQERQRINKVYQRLRQRWQRQWSAEKEKFARHGKKLQAEALSLEERQRGVHAREVAHAQEVLRFNTERELGTRQLQDDRSTLQKDRERWRKRRSHEFLVLKGIQRRTDEAQLKLKQAGQLLLDEKAAWDRQLDVLQKELHGLNNRIVHQRLRVQEQTEQIAQLDAERRRKQAEESVPPAAPDVEGAEPPPECDVVVVAEEAAAAPEDWQRRRANVDRIAAELADQRVQLLEQYGRLAEIQDAWQSRRDQAAADLEALARRLLAQEQALQQRDNQAGAAEMLLRQRQEEIDTVRQELQIWRAQLKAREQTCAQEQEQQLLALRDKEATLQEQLNGVAQLRQRWNQRRQQELEQARSGRAALAEEQKQTQEQRVALFEKGRRLDEEKRMLAEKSLALEQYRQEVFFRASDPAAQRRVERLRRRWLTLNSTLIRNAKSESEAARKEMLQIEARRAELGKSASLLTRNEGALAEKQVLLDEREVVLKARFLHLEQELGKLHSERQQSDQQHLRLQDEVDMLAKAVYAEPDGPAIDRAA